MSPVTDQVGAMIEEWRRVRLRLAELERLEHPDVTDVHGRVWVWVGGDLYTHDATLAFPLNFVTHPQLGLPSAECEDNPNYARLCATCRANFSQAQLELFAVRWERRPDRSLHGTPVVA